MTGCEGVDQIVTQQHELIALLLGLVSALIAAVGLYTGRRNGDGRG